MTCGDATGMGTPDRVECLKKSINLYRKKRMKEVFITTVGLEDIERDFIISSLDDAIEILEVYNEVKWKEFAFYCRYGYFKENNPPATEIEGTI